MGARPSPQSPRLSGTRSKLPLQDDAITPPESMTTASRPAVCESVPNSSGRSHGTESCVELPTTCRSGTCHCANLGPIAAWLALRQADATAGLRWASRRERRGAAPLTPAVFSRLPPSRLPGSSRLPPLSVPLPDSPPSSRPKEKSVLGEGVHFPAYPLDSPPSLSWGLLAPLS